jgi:hypothetical protein
VFQERLQEEQRAAADTSDLAAAVTEQDNAIRSARARILALRSQVGVLLVCWGWTLNAGSAHVLMCALTALTGARLCVCLCVCTVGVPLQVLQGEQQISKVLNTLVNPPR